MKTHQAVVINRDLAFDINKDYWILLSNPSTPEEAEVFRGHEMRGETFAVKTVEEINNHKFILR